MIKTGKKKDTVVYWREIGSFFIVAGNFHYDRKKKIHYDRKKRYSCLSDGCAVLAITTGKKKIQSSVYWVRGSGDYDRKKKRYSRLSGGCAVLAITTGIKRYSRLSGGLSCCIVSVFGSGGKLAVFLLRREIFITTGKAFFCSGGKF